MISRKSIIQPLVAFSLGAGILILPRPEGKQFQILGDSEKLLFQEVKNHFQLVPEAKKASQGFTLEVNGSDATLPAGE